MNRIAVQKTAEQGRGSWTAGRRALRLCSRWPPCGIIIMVVLVMMGCCDASGMMRWFTCATVAVLIFRFFSGIVWYREVSLVEVCYLGAPASTSH
jgi:hypothetical protein